MDRHASALELYARQWCDSPEDVVQEAFIKLAGERRIPDQPAAWLFRVVRHGAINAGKASWMRRKHEGRMAVRSDAWFECVREGGNETGLEPERVEEALSGLAMPQREVIVAHLWGGLTFEQIAAVVGGSSSGVHRLYQAGLRALRERMGHHVERIS